MLEIDELAVRYGEGSLALQRVSLSLAEGRVAAVVGGNGAGKTTLMRAVTGALGFHSGSVTEGSIRIDGVEVSRSTPSAVLRVGVAHVPEGRRVFSDLTVEENLRAGGTVLRRGRDQRIEDFYEMFEVLGRRKHQRAGLLSGGEQQMLAIARGLMSEPRLLLLDEPTLGLAPLVVDQVGQVISRIRESGTSVLVVEQNAMMALQVADDGYVMERGSIVLRGAAEDLRRSEAVQHLYLGGETDDEARGQTTQRSHLSRWSA